MSRVGPFLYSSFHPETGTQFCMGRVHCGSEAVHFPELFQGLISAWGNGANEIMPLASRWE